MKHNIYLASSWRNPFQPLLVETLRAWGHDCYDFRNPKPGEDGFHWSEIHPDWQTWNVSDYRVALGNPLAKYGFDLDMSALKACEVVVLLLPSGASSHTEAAWQKGRGGVTIVHSPEPCQPELMYKMFNAITSNEDELRGLLDIPISQLREFTV